MEVVRTERGATAMLVRAVGAGVMGVRGIQHSALSIQPFTHLLSSRHRHSKHPYRRSRRAGRMGDVALRLGECRLGRRAALDNKHPLAVPNLAYFEEKCKISLHICNFFRIFAPEIVNHQRLTTND